MNIGHVQNYKIINCSWKINVLVLIRAYWWENWSEINKRTGTFIRNSRVFNFKMKIFPIFGHLQYISDRKLGKFLF